MGVDVNIGGAVDALRDGCRDADVLRSALLLRDDEQQALFALARQRRAAAFPSAEVEMRSVIEISNICLQRCNYCAIGSTNCNNEYVIEHDDFLEQADLVYERGRRVLLVQSGENNDQAFIDHVTHCVRTIHARHPDLVLVLCLGNLSREQYAQLRDAGVDRYILKFETSNADLYAQLKPRDTLANRLACLEALLDLGFGVGSGNMVGLPGQTLDDMVADLQTLERYDLAMCSCTPFIPGEGSKLRHAPMGDVHLALNTMAIARIMHPDRLIPTTSSLEKAMPDGQYVGLMAGANTVTIHDGTPEEMKALFPIYSGKRFAPREEHIRNIVTRAGLKLAAGALR
jgi:biotin synthase